MLEKALKSHGDTKLNSSPPNKIQVWFTRLKILFFLFIGVEILLRIFGFRAGTAIDDFKFQDHPVYQKRFISDEIGINHLVENKDVYIPGIVINKQGFRGTFDYTKKSVDSIRKNTKKKIIMIVGDSFTEGCCAESFSASFPDLLNNDPNYSVLNFGVAGTDLLQYNLVLQKYLTELKPDKVVIAVYFGNDLPHFRRPATPGVPICYPFKDNRWLMSVVDNNFSKKINYVLKNDKEAYAFFVEHYTLKGSNRNIFEKLISYSVCFSKIYLGIEQRLEGRKWAGIISKIPHKDETDKEIAYSILKEINEKCKRAEVPIYFCGIPSPVDIKKVKNLRERYDPYFKDIKWYAPTDLNIDDYDGSTLTNHFNNLGHEKYAAFLKNVIKLENPYSTH